MRLWWGMWQIGAECVKVPGDLADFDSAIERLSRPRKQILSRRAMKLGVPKRYLMFGYELRPEIGLIVKALVEDVEVADQYRHPGALVAPSPIAEALINGELTVTAQLGPVVCAENPYPSPKHPVRLLVWADHRPRAVTMCGQRVRVRAGSSRPLGFVDVISQHRGSTCWCPVGRGTWHWQVANPIALPKERAHAAAAAWQICGPLARPHIYESMSAQEIERIYCG